jgi:hypothetical protein
LKPRTAINSRDCRQSASSRSPSKPLAAFRADGRRVDHA